MPTRPSVDTGRKTGRLSAAERRRILQAHDHLCQVKGPPPHGSTCSLRAVANQTHHDRETVKKVLTDRAKGKAPPTEESVTLGGVSRAALDDLVYPAPHKLIGLFKLDPDAWRRRVSEMLFPGLGGGPLYHQALRRHATTVSTFQTGPMRRLLPHKSSLDTAGIWESVTHWDEAYHQYWQCMLDWYAAVSLLVDEAFEVGIAGVIDAERQRRPSPPRLQVVPLDAPTSATATGTPSTGPIPSRPPFQLAAPFANIPVERRDRKTARQLVGLPEAYGCVLMCDLLMLVASEQPPSASWPKEVVALQTIRDEAVLAGEHLAPDSVQWQDVAQTAKKLWDEPGDPWHIRAKTEAVANAFAAVDDATGVLKERLQDWATAFR